MTRRLDLAIDSNLDDVCLIGLVINEICEFARIPPVDAYQIELCVVEAVNNSIRHAYGCRPGNIVRVAVEVGEGELRFAVQDTGKPMPARLAASLADRSRALEFDESDVKSLPEGGMGLAIAARVMDQMNYSTSDGCNSLVLTKRIPHT